MVKMLGDWNLMMEAVFRNMKELFVEALRRDTEVIEFSVLHILENLKSESFMIDHSKGFFLTSQSLRCFKASLRLFYPQLTLLIASYPDIWGK